MNEKDIEKLIQRNKFLEEENKLLHDAIITSEKRYKILFDKYKVLYSITGEDNSSLGKEIRNAAKEVLKDIGML